MSGNEPGRPDRLPGIGDRCTSRLEAAASCWLGDLALLSDNANANSFAADLGGICGGWHLSAVCMYVFLVLGTARGAAGRAFPAMLRARACKSRRCQFSVIFTGAADARKSSVGRSPFFHLVGHFFCVALLGHSNVKFRRRSVENGVFAHFATFALRSCAECVGAAVL